MAHAYEDDDEEELDEDDEDAVLARVEAAFREERGRVRGCVDLAELRALRIEYDRLASSTGAHQAGRIRARDLVELIDDRITDLKAKRLAERRG